MLSHSFYKKIWLVYSFFMMLCSVSLSVSAVDIGAHHQITQAVPVLNLNQRLGSALHNDNPLDARTLHLHPWQPLNIQFELEAGTSAGQMADWWVVALAGGRLFYLQEDLSQWREGTGSPPTFQLPIMDVPSTPSLSLPRIPPGEYDLFFGIDTQADRQLNADSVRHSHMHISVANTGHRVYVVSNQGDDNAPGNEAQPWKTLSKAASMAGAGDIVLVRGGTYKQQLVPLNSGAPGSPVVFSAYPGEKVILEGSGLNLTRNIEPGSPFSGVIHVNGINHVWIVGFTVQNAAEMGIMAYNCTDIVIQDNYVSQSASSGVAVWKSTQVLVDNNEIYKANKSKGQENLSIGEDTNDFEVRYNHVHHSASTGNGGEGLSLKDGSSNGRIHHNHVHDIKPALCMYVDAWNTHTENLKIHHNRLHDCNPHGLAITAERGGTLKNIEVYNNVMYNNTITGVHVGAGFQPDTDGIKIYNNSFYNNGKNNDFGASIILKNRNAKNIQVFNNACDSTVSQISVLTNITNLTIKNNLFAREQDKWNGEDNGENYYVGDPLWMDPDNGDFRLRSGSPAIGHGSSGLNAVTDFRGQLR